MPRKVRDAALDTREARSKLKPRGKPYWRSIGAGLHVGYRRLKGKPGTWSLRRYLGDGKYAVEAIGEADDITDADGVKVLTWWQAVEAAREADAVTPVTPYTVDEACDDYLTFLASDRSDEAVTDAQYRIDAFIRPKLGKRIVAELEPAELRTWRSAVAKQPPRLRTARGEAQRHGATKSDRSRKVTANRILSVLKAVLNHAFREEKVPSNKAWGERVKPYPGVESARARFLAIAEAGRLVNAAEPDFRRLIQAGLQTGARYSELARLLVEDFSRDVGTIHIRKSKTSKERFIVLTSEGVAFFKSIAAGRPRGSLMLPKANGDPWGPSQQTGRMQEICKRAVIEPPIGFHGLRHTWASHSVMNGVPLMVVAKNLGHADTRMVEKHYGHLAPSYVADEIRKGAPQFGLDPGNVAVLS